GALLVLVGSAEGGQAPDRSNARRPKNEADLRYWLENMVTYHRFTVAEVCEATSLTADEVTAALRRFNIAPGSRPRRPAGAPLLVLPYPGGPPPPLGFPHGAGRPPPPPKRSALAPCGQATSLAVH